MRSSWIFWRKGTNAWRDSPFSEISVMRTCCIQKVWTIFPISTRQEIASINHQHGFQSIQDRQMDHLHLREVFPSHGGFLDVAVYNATGLSQTKGVRRRNVWCRNVRNGSYFMLFQSSNNKKTEVWQKYNQWKPQLYWYLNPSYYIWRDTPLQCLSQNALKGTRWDYSKALPNISPTHFTTVSIGKPPCVWYGLASSLILIELYE